MAATAKSGLSGLSIRWRVALTSAGMTFLILAGFAALVGQLTTERLRDDFDGRLTLAAADLQEQLRVERRLGGGYAISGPDLDDYAAAEDAVIRVVSPQGRVLESTHRAPPLAIPQQEAVELGSYRVVARPIASPLGLPVAWVQYARRFGDLKAAIRETWLLLLLGVTGGSLLALTAGWAVARRALSPIFDLTRAAREVERTQDPTVTLPAGQSKDEVTELASTLAAMLQALERARAAREGAFQAQKDFIADASHELRTPLTSILANLELLEAELADRVEGRDAVSAARRSAQRMRKLVNDLLLLARADAGHKSAHAPVDISEVLADVLGEFAPVLDGRILKRSGSTEPVTISGNSEELHRLIANLVQNSLQHTPDGTVVEVGVVDHGETASLSVDDSGPGIADECRDRIFDRFYHGKESSRGGFGLGLAIVRSISTAHGGTVSVESSKHGGARFVVTLPKSSSSG